MPRTNHPENGSGNVYDRHDRGRCSKKSHRRLADFCCYTQVARLHKQIIVSFSMAEQTSVKYAVNNASLVYDIWMRRKGLAREENKILNKDM